MAKDIVSYCDAHEPGAEVRGETRRIDLGDGVNEVEICKQCWATMTVGELEGVIAAWGRPLTPQDTKQKMRCPWCPRSLSTPRNLRDHVDTKHPENVAAFVAGLVSAPSSKSRAEPTHAPEPPPGPRKREPRACPECGRVLQSPQGWGAHRWRAHGVKGAVSK